MDQTPTKAVIERRQTIVIKLPSLMQERLLAFPVLHLIRDAFPDADLHFISPQHKIEMLYSLPFQGYWHPWDDDGVGNIFEAHRFATTLKVGAVDIYISFGNTVTELALGTFLSAKKKVGFADGWKAWFTNVPVKRPVGHHKSEEFFELFKTMSNIRIPEKLRVMGKSLPPFFKDNEDSLPYLAIDLYPFSPGKLDSFWFDYFSLFEGKRFALFFSQEEAKGGLLAESFIERLPKRNKYELFLNGNWIELGKMLSHARGLVARSGPSISYATYLGTSALAIYERGDPRLDAPFYNFANWQLLDVRDPTIGQTEQANGVLKAKAMVDPLVLFEHTNEVFRF